MTFRIIKQLKYFIALMMTFSSFESFSQTEILSHWKSEFEHASDLKKKQECILKICQNNFSFATDSLWKYLQVGQQIIPPNTPNYYLLQSYYASYLSKTGQQDSAISVVDGLLQDEKILSENPEIRTRVIIEKSRNLIMTNRITEATELSFKLLAIGEAKNDTSIIIKSYILLGWINLELGNYRESIRWLSKGSSYLFKDARDKEFPSLFTNRASCYNNIEKFDSAMIDVEMGLKLATLQQNLSATANALNVRADIYLNLRNIPAAQKDLEAALAVREKLGDPFYVLSDMAQLSTFYAYNNQTAKGTELALKGIAIAEKSTQLSKLIFLYTALSENYRNAKQYDKLATTLEKLIVLKDSLYADNAAKTMADLEGKYEFQKKENTIIQQKFDLTKSKYLTIGLISILVLILILFWSLFKNYQFAQNRKLNAVIIEQKNLSEAAVLSAEENERKRIAADLHDNIGANAAAIMAGVGYLKDGIYNSNDVLGQLEENASGMVNNLNETIWVLKNERLRFTDLSDRFKLWLQRHLANYPEIKYHLTEEIIEDLEFTPNKTLQLFLILKETINNAIKHSQCKDIHVFLFCDNTWSITIEDNGIGINNNSIVTGNGLNNMRNRAKECGWNIGWSNATPSGTRVTINELL